MTNLYRLAYTPEEQEVAEAEAWALIGVEPKGRRLLTADRAVDVTGAAHVALGAAELAAGPDLAELAQAVAALQLAPDRFRIEVAKSPAARGLPLPDSPVIARTLADCLDGYPDLSHPQIEFVCLASPGDWRFGQVLSRSDRGWSRHRAVPHSYSNALPTRLARAMVNLVATPGDTIIDPCCGVGTILIEAESAGIAAVGFELNERLARYARANLRHFGLPARVAVGDARHIGGRCDAVVTDLPYGWTTPVDRNLYADILANAASLAPRLAVVSGDDLTDLLSGLGLHVQRVARHGRPSARRFLHVAASV